MVLLPVRPVSLTQKNPQRRKIICGMHLVGHKDIDRSEDVFVVYPVCVIPMAVLVAVVK